MKKTTKKTTPTIVKSNKLVEARYSLGLQEQRLMLLALSKLNSTNKLPKERIQMSVSEYTAVFGNHKDLYADIKTAAKSLLRRVVTIEKDDGGWKMFQIASYAELTAKTGIIELEFHGEMAPYISELKKCFTKIELPQLAGFTSAHALRVYENMLKWEPETCLEITVEDLKKMLGLYDEKKKKFDYPAFKDFENRVLKPAKEQIALHTPHKLEYQKVGGRGPAGIRFIKFFLTFKNKKKSKEVFDSLHSTITQINGETTEQPSFNWNEEGKDDSKTSQSYFDEKANPF